MSYPKPFAMGSYGCIYKPSLECKNTSKIGEISKISPFKSDDAKNESKIVKVLRKIDPDQKRLVYYTKSCTPKISMKGLSKHCPLINRNKEYRSYMMSHAGRKIGDSEKMSFDKFKGYFIDILKATNLLHKNGIVHNDLHGGNLMVRWGRARIIDFGLSVKVEESNIENFLFEGPIIQYPLFVNILYRNTNKAEIKDEFRNSGYGDIHPDFREYLECLNDARKEFGEKRYFKEVVLPNVYKIDSYTVGDSFYQLYRKYRKTFKDFPKFKEKDATKLKKVLVAMMNPDMFEQYTVKQALDEIEK